MPGSDACIARPPVRIAGSAGLARSSDSPTRWPSSGAQHEPPPGDPRGADRHRTAHQAHLRAAIRPRAGAARVSDVETAPELQDPADDRCPVRPLPARRRRPRAMKRSLPSRRALLAAHVAALIRTRLRASPAKAETRIGVAGPGGLYDIIHVGVLDDGEIFLEVDRRR